MTYTIAKTPELLTAALALTKGCYQDNLLLGSESWSGATLRGKAARFGGRYKASRDNLFGRIVQAGIPARFETINRRKMLVLGE